MPTNPVIDSRDVRFILFELLEIDQLTQYEKYKDFDKDMFQEVLELAETIAVRKVYPVNAEADKKGAAYDPATKMVKIPEEMFSGLDAYYEAGFLGLAIEQEYGGMGMPHALDQAVIDYFSSASMSFTMYPALSIGAFNLIKQFYAGPDKEMIMEKFLSGEWGGTMCLTESDAGSDVGALKTKAIKDKDNTFKIIGQKIFISSGDNNYYKNIIHPVLARVEGDPAGTKGISIFLVPKIKMNADGTLGGSNDVVCSGIEHKMGIRASSTCTLNFGDDNNCSGVIMGKQTKGMSIMFHMMNEARLYVGSQGMSVSSAAYMHAVTYAKNRLQGAHVTQMLNPEAKSVPIIQHPDVKRMLLNMKAKVEAMRVLTYYCAYLSDLVDISDENGKKEHQDLLDFLIPITKAGNTDTAWDVTGDAIQVYGGYGYCSDYPVEQYARDAKILSLYEGTNGIQSLDLAMRKILMDKEQIKYSVYKKKVQETIAKAKGIVDEKYIDMVKQGLAKIDAVVEMMKKQMTEGKFLHLFANATPLQKAFTFLTFGWMHLWTLVVAIPQMKQLVADKKGEERDKLLKDNNEAAYYSGRVLSAQFFLGAEFQKFIGYCDYILQGESAVIKANETTFTGAPEE